MTKPAARNAKKVGKQVRSEPYIGFQESSPCKRCLLLLRTQALIASPTFCPFQTQHATAPSQTLRVEVDREEGGRGRRVSEVPHTPSFSGLSDSMLYSMLKLGNSVLCLGLSQAIVALSQAGIGRRRWCKCRTAKQGQGESCELRPHEHAQAGSRLFDGSKRVREACSSLHMFMQERRKPQRRAEVMASEVYSEHDADPVTKTEDDERQYDGDTEDEEEVGVSTLTIYMISAENEQDAWVDDARGLMCRLRNECSG